MGGTEKLLLNVLKAENIRKDELMKNHTSFKIGGPADFMVFPETPEQTARLIKVLDNAGEKYELIGNGSNLLVSDSGIRGTVISTVKMSDVTVCGNTITALCGATLAKAAAKAANASLTGLEFASGIPGTVGGAVVMNAGAYGGEMKDVVKKVLCYDGTDLKELSAEECDFSYRHSAFSAGGYVVLSCLMELENGDKEKITEKMLELNRKRAEKQPLNFPSAGSTFKRPEGYFAAALIEECGLKGVSSGGAQVSEKHSGFIVNTGGATCDDVRRLMEICVNTVYEKCGVTLEPEVKIM